MSEPALLEIRNATIWRGSTCVFRDLDLKIEQHERVAILGPNGSGKTTLLKTINREVYPVATEQPSVTILGKHRWNVWELRKQIGVISDDLHQRYHPHATALDVVLSGFFSSVGVHGNIATRLTTRQVARAGEVLEELGIGELRDRQLCRMSTGQQRRCLLGRALVHRPSTLILDEPTAGLDLAAGFDFLSRIRRLTEKGCNIVVVTHHLHEIPPEVDRVILLSAGQIVADGAKQDVLCSDALSLAYGTRIGVTQAQGYFLAYPGDASENGNLKS